MTRRLFMLATLSFWLAVVGFAASHWWLPARVAETALATPASAAGDPTTAATADASRSLAEVGRHREADDCWMAINGEVYDLSRYLPEHPSDPEVILAWCGREASQAYQTKGRGRPHSARADRLLAEYRIARLQQP